MAQGFPLPLAPPERNIDPNCIAVRGTSWSVRPLAINPSYPRARHTYGNYLELQGRFDEGLAEVRQAQVLDPLSPRINYDLGRQLIKHGQYDLAIEQFKKTLELQPDFRPAHGQLGRAFLRKGQYESVGQF